VSPSVTVVIATHNRLDLFREAVASVIGQQAVTWQLVVVDDASTDGTPEWLGGIEDPRITSLRSETPVERSVARNRGLEKAAAPFVLFLDDDDLLVPSALRLLAEALERAPDAFAAVGGRALFDADGHRRRAIGPRIRLRRKAWREVVSGWIAVPGQMLFRTDVVRASGGWDESLAGPEDQELWLRLGYVRPVVFVPGTVVQYRLHGPPRIAPDNYQAEERIREAFVAQLSGRDARVARRLMIARHALADSNRGFAAGDYRVAASGLFGAVRAAPELLVSPIVGASIAASIVKASAAAVLPHGLARAADAQVKRARERLRRAPSGTRHSSTGKQ
jgi:glycosyltransferase involved in cell wall biosynthesis